MYLSTLGLRVIKKKKKHGTAHLAKPVTRCSTPGGLVFKAHRRLYLSTLDSRVIKKKHAACGTKHGETHCLRVVLTFSSVLVRSKSHLAKASNVKRKSNTAKSCRFVHMC